MNPYSDLDNNSFRLVCQLGLSWCYYLIFVYPQKKSSIFYLGSCKRSFELFAIMLYVFVHVFDLTLPYVYMLVFVNKSSSSKELVENKYFPSMCLSRVLFYCVCCTFGMHLIGTRVCKLQNSIAFIIIFINIYQIY